MPGKKDNTDNQFEADLEVIENAMNSIMQGAFSTMFKQVFDSGIFGSTEGVYPGVIDDDNNNATTTTTTIFNGRNINSGYGAIAEEEEDFGGSDFKRLSKKSKSKGQGMSIEEQIGTVATTSNPLATRSSTGLIFNLLFQTPPAEMFRQPARKTAPVLVSEHSQNPKDESNWSFSSTSSKTIYRPDGTQETVITKKTNGVTETIKQIRYPDGRTEETREQKGSLWHRFFGDKKG